MRLIDADKLRTIRSIQSGDFNSIETIQKWIDDAPTIDAEPVVRCKDCIYYYPFAEIKGKGECHIVEDAGCLTWYEDCDYCSYGERRSEDEAH